MKSNKLLGFTAILGAALLILPGASLADESAQLTQGQAGQNSITFGFRLTGGASLLMRNDFNDHMQGLNDLVDDNSFYSADSEFELIKMGTDASGEILISFMPNLSIGIGAGYLSAGKETTAELHFYGFDEDITYHPKFSAIPITLSFYYGIPIGNTIKAVLNAGFGYYIGTVSYDYYYEERLSSYWYEEEETWSAKSNALGFHGGIDLDFGIAPNLALVVGIKGRYAKLTDLTGDTDWEYQVSYGFSGSGTDEDETLWFGDYEYASRDYPRLILRPTKPTGSYWSNVREAEVNLSGIVFQAGIKVFF